MIDRDDTLDAIVPGGARDHRVADVVGVSGVHLLERHHNPEAAAGLGRDVDALDARHLHGLEVVPERGGAVERLDHVNIVDRLAHRGGPHDGLVAVKNALDAQHRLRVVLALVAGVVAGVLAKRSLLHQLVRVDEALGNDLGIGRQGQAGELGLEHRHRAPAQRAGNVVLVDLRADQGRGRQEQHRVAADHVGGRHQFAALGVLLHVHVAVLALDDLRAQDILAQHLSAVSAQIGPAGVRILRDKEAGSNEEAAAIVRVEPGRRKHLDIHRIAFDDVFKHRRVLYDCGLDHLLGGQLHPLLGQLAHRQRGVLLQRNGKALRRGEGTGENRNVVTLDVLVQQARAFLLFIDLGDVAEFKFPVDFSLDAVQLPVGLQCGDKTAQVINLSCGGTCIHVCSCRWMVCGL